MAPMMMEVLESAVVIKGLPGCNEVVPPVAAVEVLASNNGGGGMELVVFIQFIAWFAEVMEPVLALALAAVILPSSCAGVLAHVAAMEDLVQ